ncbi:unnamed protein product, partial [Prorocentrum cordatum]
FSSSSTGPPASPLRRFRRCSAISAATISGGCSTSLPRVPPPTGASTWGPTNLLARLRRKWLYVGSVVHALTSSGDGGRLTASVAYSRTDGPTCSRSRRTPMTLLSPCSSTKRASWTSISH